MTNRVPSRTREGLRFREDVAKWACRLRVQPSAVHLRLMTRKWASCSSGGLVSFSTRLLEQSPEFREIVIVHELLHLKVPNHGRLFKTLLRVYLPKSPEGSTLTEG